jgi:hypothetical protein
MTARQPARSASFFTLSPDDAVTAGGRYQIRTGGAREQS